MPHRNLYAAVDLGSNSFHMLVARREGGELRVIDKIREMVRIGGGLDANGRLDETTRSRALECLARFGQRLARIPEHQVRAVGTQTFRRLHQPQHFLVVAETALGFPIDIISGREEARLVWLGVNEGTAFSERARMVIDIGGGSTEFAAGLERDPDFAESIQFGCVSVTRRAFGKGRITARRWRRAGEEIATELQAIAPKLAATGWQHAIGSSGTIRAVQSILAAENDTLPDPIPAARVDALAQKMIDFGHVDEVDLPGLSNSRRPVIAGGILVLQACMQKFGIDRLDVSPFALREGLLHDQVGRLEQRDPREKTVVGLAERFQVDQDQAERVRDFALCAFEQITEEFGLNRVHRDLLDWICQLHEIGLGIAHSHYQIHSAYVVEHSDMPGFTHQEQQFMAFMLRYQRRKLPDDALDALPARLHGAARPMLAILRLAVALARSRTDTDLPDFALSGGPESGLRLALPPGWLAGHPLSARSLELERRQLARMGLKLVLSELSVPHPVRA
ncbi:MAG: Ppx/GppA family phosphatase [Wenzhouxiangellaceae bacterium]|nr:Ppx/GppA family phosphatase [Wenzhouxiangellaceae bacterium]MBS3745926.1 Ppx/GppA family phosphatase [Wenzhouxiangellaceae bacterium]MBS3822838.1 Ppx/GppA family phosphatase [Wenzhouxiangellaceae bacterium]